MEILRVFNNNLVLSLDENGREVILTGRGLGFQAHPGQSVDPAKVVRRFVPADGRDPDHLAELLAGIPPEHIHLVSEAVTEVGLTKVADNPALIIAIADHISFAIRRVNLDMAITYPLLAEVKHLYAEEYTQALQLLTAINDHLPTKLPDTEAVGLALHLVNAGFATGDLSYTYQMTGVIQQMVDVIERAYGTTLDSGSVSVGRFITHLRYLFVRIHNHKQLADEPTTVGRAIREAFPEASEVAVRLGGVLELRLGTPLTTDEISYLALHVARVTTDR
ncbi:PRD domain-containing protein [Micropruina sonneratiae]|uniref:PRD domain-containing protein n=1 Tax=Micropruina sonneratiae TaxID=2986940 RepID=UPI002226711A|nr:PRD domain-containing protein [Micropruina sp. KQZ13P-5]MCW3158386.1 PRD domain-containing protein [Micropruina sp. KQZ13P-5]